MSLQDRIPFARVPAGTLEAARRARQHLAKVGKGPKFVVADREEGAAVLAAQSFARYDRAFLKAGARVLWERDPNTVGHPPKEKQA